MFIRLLSLSFGESLGSDCRVVKCVSLNNQPYQSRQRVIDINSNNLFYYLFNVSANKCCISCNTIDDPYDRICIPNKVKNINVKVFNLLLRMNET